MPAQMAPPICPAPPQQKPSMGQRMVPTSPASVPPQSPVRPQVPQQQCGPTGQQKQNRMTSVSRPVGIDPLHMLQERENR